MPIAETQDDAAVALSLDQDVELDIAGVVEGADKSSVVAYAWDYLRHYESVFRPLRNRPITIMEVGVRSGCSLRLWEWYFPAASIVGIDIDPACRAHATDRVRIEIGSQADPDFLEAVCRADPPAIFIDDGSHLADHNILTFEYAFPRLLPGGLYIVEDLKFHLGARAANWQGATPRDAPGYFLDLARSCLGASDAREPGDDTARLPRMVDRVLFVGGAVIVMKRKVQRAAGRAVRLGRAYAAARAPDAQAYLRLAAYALKHGGHEPGALLGEADAACDAALAAGAPLIEGLTMKAETQLRLGRRAAAIALLHRAASGHVTDRRALMQLARQQVAAGLVAEASATIGRVLQLAPGHGPALHLRQRLAAASG
jgi:hypothetical protein